MSGSLEKKKITPRSFWGVTWNVTKLLLVPHHANNYKPHIIRNYSIILVLATVVGLQFGYNAIRTGDVLGQKTDITISSLFQKTNIERQKVGEAPLKLNNKLGKAAYLKVQNMFTNQYWAHNAPDGTTPWKWFGDVGYNYDQAGENLAKNFNTTDAAMLAWMNSPEHKANILDANYSEVGFAVMDGQLDGKPTSLIVALYGAPASGMVMGMSRFNGADSIGQISLLGQFDIAMLSMSPALLLGIGLIILLIIVALSSHLKRHKLPKKMAKSWRRHYGLYKATVLVVFCLLLIFISSSGQI